MAYVAPRGVLQEAGLWHPEFGETLTGTANGVNTIFYVAHKPLAQNTDGLAVSTADVTVYVNGATVTVNAVNATTGALTLQVAPVADADVTADYVYSAVAQDVVTGVIEEADATIDLELGSVTTVPLSPVSAIVRKIARFYAAGLLMAREYGLQSITEETTKEGERKLKQAEEWLDSYRERLVSNTADTGDYDVPRATPDKRIFEQYDASSGNWLPLNDSPVTIRRPE